MSDEEQRHAASQRLLATVLATLEASEIADREYLESRLAGATDVESDPPVPAGPTGVFELSDDGGLIDTRLEPVQCTNCRENYVPARNHLGACFGHAPEISRDDCDPDLERRVAKLPNYGGSVWKLRCCSKYYGSGSPDTPTPFSDMHQDDLLQGGGFGDSCYRGICSKSVSRGVGTGAHLPPEAENAYVDLEMLDNLPAARRATAETLAALQLRYDREDRKLTKEQCIAELMSYE
jgi:hypothetical protein